MRESPIDGEAPIPVSWIAVICGGLLGAGAMSLTLSFLWGGLGAAIGFTAGWGLGIVAHRSYAKSNKSDS
jgi:membrane protein DedA with SNARE-associated domain